MELQAPRGILVYDVRLTGQGKGMPGMAAFGADDENAPQGAQAPASAAPADAAGAGPSAPPTQQPDMFDNWLRAELSRLYDTTLSEPVPHDMLRLLHGARKT
jgi:hypothetical protein